jgi:hypothetical protein
MLRELIASLLAHAAPGARRAGYVHELVAVEARGRRRAAAWAPHRERCRAAILAAADRCPRHRTAVIMGAGALGDIPLDDLAGRFARVLLVDIALLSSTWRRIRRHPHVQPVLLDLTGTVGQLQRGGPLPVPGSQAFLGDPSVDLVVSANILSQLPLIPVALARRSPGIDAAAAEAFGRAIVEAHLAHLAGFAGEVCLISDLAWTRREAGGAERTQVPLYGCRLPPGEEWDWPVAPPGELAGGASQVNRVRALRPARR